MVRPVVHAWVRTVAVAISVVMTMTVLLASPASAATPPGPPTNMTAAAGDGVVSISWLPPADDGGAPITDYAYTFYIQGTTFLYRAVGGTQTSIVLTGEDDYIFNDLGYVITLRAVNAIGYSEESEFSAEVTPRAGAPTPQTALTAIPAAGGSTTTDPGGVGPTSSDPVTTTVNVPATLSGGTVSIAETTPSESPIGFVFLGQEIVIHSTASTDVANPLQITFQVDASLVPVTVFRNGVPVEASCDPVGTATPSPCIAAGVGTSKTTILTASASVWNVGVATYPFDGFFSPVDRTPVANSTKAGSVIPIRFGLGGDRGQGVLATGYPKSRDMACDPTASLDGVEETVSGSANLLTYSPGTRTYQFNWKTDRSWAGTCREFVIRFREGTVARATFAFR